MDLWQDLKALQDLIQASLITTTRTAGQISAEDLSFQRSLDPEVGTSLDERSARLLALSSELLKSAASISEISVPELQDPEDVDNNWRNVVDVIDALLEKADTCLDEYTGVIKRRDFSNGEQTPSKSKKNTSSLGNSFRTQNLVKPQLSFQNKPNNDDKSPWLPLLTTKPHAILSLQDSLTTFTNSFNQLQYRHPYETEISQMKYPDAVYQQADPISYLPIDETSAVFVDTPEEVLQMLKELKTATEIAVDLEHHDMRSYVGLVSLMQISTRNKDWIVDTLKPWRQNLQVLNEVFADPNIIKVFHGAYMDIVWLQRDLGLYVVGLFDTHWASRVLGYPGGSLAYLLRKFIDFEADKRYQLADWRMRPLPDEMFFYARADTHFLLFIYDNMRNELADVSNPAIPDQSKIEQVLQKSKETSLLRFERQIYDVATGKGPGGWYSLLIKTPAHFSNEQFAVFRAVHAWRDHIARADDDSPAFVMPNKVIYSIANVIPMDMVALLGVAHPISHSVKSRTGELLALIKSAKASGKDGPSMMDVLRPDSTAKANLPPLGAESATKNLVVAVDESHLWNEKSKFWGGAFGSSIWDTPSVIKPDDGLRLAIPLPQLSSEIFAVSNDITDKLRMTVNGPTQSISADAQIMRHTQKEDDEPFQIKRGAKRKIDTKSETEETNGEFDISLNEEEEKANRERVARRAERKAAKKLKKSQQKLAEAETGSTDSAEIDDEEPFDYSKAESVLHAKQGSGDQRATRQKKPFDPYAKSADAPKGMRRLQTERPGKSYTFKS